MIEKMTKRPEYDIIKRVLLNGRNKVYICICHATTEKMVKDCIEKNSCTSVAEVQKLCRAGTECGTCIPWIKKVLQEKKGIENKLP